MSVIYAACINSCVKNLPFWWHMMSEKKWVVMTDLFRVEGCSEGQEKYKTLWYCSTSDNFVLKISKDKWRKLNRQTDLICCDEIELPVPVNCERVCMYVCLEDMQHKGRRLKRCRFLSGLNHTTNLHPNTHSVLMQTPENVGCKTANSCTHTYTQNVSCGSFCSFVVVCRVCETIFILLHHCLHNQWHEICVCMRTHSVHLSL